MENNNKIALMYLEVLVWGFVRSKSLMSRNEFFEIDLIDDLVAGSLSYIGKGRKPEDYEERMATLKKNEEFLLKQIRDGKPEIVRYYLTQLVAIIRFINISWEE